MHNNLDFIIVDNNALNCFIAEKILHNIDKEISVHTFINAQEAMNYVKKTDTEGRKSVLLLDIHMPLMDGFQFLDEFQALPQYIQDSYMIYIITSSTDVNDKIKSGKTSLVKKFISKPLTFNMMHDIINSMAVTV